MERDLTGRCGTCSFYIALRPVGSVEGVAGWEIPETVEGADTEMEGECRLGCWLPPLRDDATCSHHKPRGTAWDVALKRKKAAGTPRAIRDDEDAGDAAPKRPLPQEIDIDMDQDEFRRVLREVLREELGVGEVALADRWRGGEVIIKSVKEGVAPKSVPIDSLFHKIVMIRDKLRVLEQKVNGTKGLEDDEKVQLQQYITACYGTLTTFNVLFRERDDWFVGASGKGD